MPRGYRHAWQVPVCSGAGVTEADSGLEALETQDDTFPHPPPPTGCCSAMNFLCLPEFKFL